MDNNMERYKIININNIEHIVYKFKYASTIYNGIGVFFLLEDNNTKVKSPQIGEIYIRIPTWVDMQDLYQSSCQYNIMTKEYTLNSETYRNNKVSRICVKLVDSDGKVTIMDSKVRDRLNPLLAQFILERVEETIGIYYLGTGLSSEEEEQLSYDCFKYYSSIYKKYSGKEIVIPPVPSPVLMMNICNVFGCTPDVARRISKRDIDMTMIAKEQESICKHPSLIGLK